MCVWAAVRFSRELPLTSLICTMIADDRVTTGRGPSASLQTSFCCSGRGASNVAVYKANFLESGTRCCDPNACKSTCPTKIRKVIELDVLDRSGQSSTRMACRMSHLISHEFYVVLGFESRSSRRVSLRLGSSGTRFTPYISFRVAFYLTQPLKRMLQM